MNSRTQTPVNAVWLVMILSGILGVLSFSEAALSSLAGCVHLFYTQSCLLTRLIRAAVIGLYTSYVTPIFLRITSGRTKLVLGPFNLGKWYTLSGSIAVAWVAFIIVLLLFPTAQRTTAAGMSESLRYLVL